MDGASAPRRATLLVASSNRKKLGELLGLLGGSGVELKCLADFPPVAEPAETGATFAENAAIKARAYSAASGLLTLADDSGLEVDALGGAPGVYSARYASAESGSEGNAPDAANRAKLLREMQLFPRPRRTARFRCTVCVARAGDVLFTTEGRIEGAILHEERGAGGFGYDPLFQPLGHDRTFAQMTPEEKARISHRARALAALKPILLQYLSAHPEL